MTQLEELAVDFLVFIVQAAIILPVILFVVGEIVEHFTP